jgi:hypothetical protein
LQRRRDPQRQQRQPDRADAQFVVAEGRILRQIVMAVRVAVARQVQRRRYRCQQRPTVRVVMVVVVGWWWS